MRREFYRSLGKRGSRDASKINDFYAKKLRRAKLDLGD
jgi:hypothetical protein